jgi:asparagine synthase (glutamine-hydrolysing)
MLETIKHRGRDDQGVFADDQVGIGCNRLSIIDVAGGHQPLSNEEGTIWLVQNGEIYNYQALREALHNAGHRLQTQSDTEAIAHAYEEWGPDCFKHLKGMFAIALWDGTTHTLHLARDRVGIKPLYYTLADGQFIFGSEIKAILQHGSVSREPDPQALDAYLTFLISPAPLTLFKNIRKLEPGHCMVVEQDGTIRKEQYWDPVPIGEQASIDVDGTPVPHSRLLHDGSGMTEESCISTIRSLLKQSIKDRMMSDVPFGVFLSGGIDSSTNVALMAELMDRPVETFSVGFRDLEKYNELGYARQIATQFKTNHHEVIIDQSMAFDFLPGLIYHQDEPLADPVCMPLYFVSRLARDNGTIVVQVGEGSDEQFAGYNSMLRELRFYKTFWKAYLGLPRVAKSAIYRIAEAYLKRTQGYLALDYIRKGLEGEELFWGGAVNFTETHKRRLIDGKQRVDDPLPHVLAKRWHDEILMRDPSADYLKRMIYLEFKSRLPELLLMRVDKVSMATSIEARVPFLDHRMVEYSMTIPQKLKIKNGETKYILKKAVEGIVPESIIYRQKQGFAAPVSEWLRNEWSGFAESRILGSALVRQGTLRQEFINAMIKGHREHKIDAGQNIWNLLNLALWYDYWIEGKDV